MQEELLCELKAKMDMVLIGAVPEGIRVNFPFAGDVSGEISGKCEGVDYVLTRPDGAGVLHIHGVITTEEGDLISLEASGNGIPTREEGRYALKGAITFQTGSEKYAWLNTTLAVGKGYADINKKQLYIKAFVPFQPKE